MTHCNVTVIKIPRRGGKMEITRDDQRLRDDRAKVRKWERRQRRKEK